MVLTPLVSWPGISVALRSWEGELLELLVCRAAVLALHVARLHREALGWSCTGAEASPGPVGGTFPSTPQKSL